MPEAPRGTLEQRRARHVLDRFNDREPRAATDYWESYGQLTKTLPGWVRTNGVLMAVAMAATRRTAPAERDLLDDWATWIERECGLPGDQASPTRDRLQQVLIQGEPRLYRRIERESLAILAWLKVLAKQRLEQSTAGGRGAGAVNATNETNTDGAVGSDV